MSIIKLNNQAVKNATSFGSISSLGSMVFIKKLTASSSATLSFVDGSDGVVLDDTYKEYVFTFNNMHPATDNVHFQFNMSTDSGSNYNVTKTSTMFRSFHFENDSLTTLAYDTNFDLAQSTNFQTLAQEISSDNEDSCSGTLRIFNPSSDTFVKHFISTFNMVNLTPVTMVMYGAGYGNTVNPIDAIRFQMSSGNIDAGDICLYGIA